MNTRLAVYSLRETQALREALGLDYDADCRGILKLFHSRRELDNAVEASALTESLGVRFPAWSPPALRNWSLPWPASARRSPVASTDPDDESGDARRFTEALGAAVVERGGELRLNETIERIDGDAGGVRRWSPTAARSRRTPT
ncbi:MAG: FAD-dependent oxidoreductase [Arhodomonas sp.]|nr:FAD-dependent oxidoreductase [Arhodomonas sp.]